MFHLRRLELPLLVQLAAFASTGRPDEIFRMGKNSFELKSASDPRWIDTVLGDFDAFLIDHASCERKANALLMSMIVKYPDRTGIIPRLIQLAQEELEHFAETYAFMADRGLLLGKDEPDPYVNQLLAAARHGRDERFIDRMLIAAVIEKRGAERFQIVAEHVSDPDLAAFYEKLWKCEVKHAQVFVLMLHKEFSADLINARLNELIELEAQVISGLEFRPALH
jgi:tRNA-(ms[2]io[6]A)-hydroxylase